MLAESFHVYKYNTYLIMSIFIYNIVTIKKIAMKKKNDIAV